MRGNGHTCSDLAISLAQGRYFRGLLLLLVLFIFRVAGQLVQKLHPISVLPPFERWFSGALAYEWLLGSQILIIFIMSHIVFRFARKRIVPKANLGKWLVVVGGVYFSVMAIRLILGLTIAIDHSWLGATIPAIFHLVLALFILLVGRFHLYFAKDGEVV